MAKSKWKPRREFKVVDEKRSEKKKKLISAHAFESPDGTDIIDPKEFERELQDLGVKDIFQSATGRRRMIGGVEKMKHDGQILMMEWAIKFPDITPKTFLIERRGYSQAQAKQILESTGGVRAWDTEKTKVLDKMSESVIKRHIDKLVEVNDQHIAASKLGLAKAIEMLSKMSVTPELDADGKPSKKAMRSIDLLNVLNAIEKAQTIYRRAMGLPNEESGLAQILDKVAQISVQQNVQINNNNTVVQQQAIQISEKEKELEKLDFDQLFALIELKREADAATEK